MMRSNIIQNVSGFCHKLHWYYKILTYMQHTYLHTDGNPQYPQVQILQYVYNHFDPSTLLKKLPQHLVAIEWYSVTVLKILIELFETLYAVQSMEK